jgi:hypothetical protein
MPRQALVVFLSSLTPQVEQALGGSDVGFREPETLPRGNDLEVLQLDSHSIQHNPLVDLRKSHHLGAVAHKPSQPRFQIVRF